MPYVKAADYQRLVLAEEVCFTVILGMAFGFLPIKEQELRDYLAAPMQKWADAAVATDVLKDGPMKWKGDDADAFCPDCLRQEQLRCDLTTGGIQCHGECIRCERALNALSGGDGDDDA